MPESEGRTLFVLTPRGERGPIDRAEMRELLQRGEIALGDHVRNAFGRPLGCVCDLARARVSSTGRNRPIGPADAIVMRAGRRQRTRPATILMLTALGVTLAGLLIAIGGRLLPPSSPLETMAEAPRSQAPPATPPAPMPPSAPALPSGLVAEFFILRHVPNALPEFDRLTPALRRIETSINVSHQEAWPGTDLATLFAMRATGILRVTSTGIYTFALASVGPARLNLGSQVIIDIGAHADAKELTGNIRLEAGDHQLVLLYAHGEGPPGCSLAWWSEERPRQVVGESSLFHQPD